MLSLTHIHYHELMTCFPRWLVEYTFQNWIWHELTYNYLLRKNQGSRYVAINTQKGLLTSFWSSLSSFNFSENSGKPTSRNSKCLHFSWWPSYIRSHRSGTFEQFTWEVFARLSMHLRYAFLLPQVEYLGHRFPRVVSTLQREKSKQLWKPQPHKMFHNWNPSWACWIIAANFYLICLLFSSVFFTRTCHGSGKQHKKRSKETADFLPGICALSS